MASQVLVSSVGEDVLKLQNTSVFVLGDLILDTYISGKVTRISPEAPVPVVLQDKSWAVLGGAANVAANIASFGANVWLAGRLGADADGDSLINLCKSLEIHTDSILRVSSAPTTKKLRVMAGYQQLVRIDSEKDSELTLEEQAQIERQFSLYLKLPQSKALVVSDYGKGVCSERLLKNLIKAAIDHNVPVITDPKSLDLKKYAGSDIMKPNLSEGRALLRVTQPTAKFASFDEEVNAICKELIANKIANNVVLSLSEKGVLATGKSFSKPERYSSEVLQVADVSGAGDTMIAFLAMGAAARINLSRVVQFANIASGIVCTKLGTATVSSSEFLEYFKHETEETAPEKVLGANELKNILDQEREEGRKIVFTNGCFDLLHAGHVETLQKSKSFGDLLVVALNSDASVSKLKGPTRPLQSENDRARIMAALACVDYVTIFDQPTPLELIKLFKPSVLVKGGDWSEESIVGSKEIKEWGGVVQVIPLVEGRSTTSLVEKSRNNK